MPGQLFLLLAFGAGVLIAVSVLATVYLLRKPATLSPAGAAAPVVAQAPAPPSPIGATVSIVPEKPAPIAAFNLIMKRRSLAGSAIGGIRETQEMLDFCSEHGITADVEMIRIQQVNEAYERLLKGDVKYRFVIDNASLR